jgi:hypothetical protein
MFDLSMLSFNSMGIRYGASKLFQILIPLASYILIRDLVIQDFLLRQPIVQALIQNLSKHPFFKSFSADLPLVFEQTLGFMAWKIGCDLGFFLIVSGLGPWERAFTWAGLIPYTIVQYFFYYLIGRKMIIEGVLNPFKPNLPQIPSSTRPALWKRIFAKYFHEDMNVTSENTALRQVILKPWVDYAGLVTSWSLYTVGMFFIQSGEINLAPVINFSFFQMLTFYLVNTYGYILGFNLGEFLYLGLAQLEEFFSEWKREKAVFIFKDENPFSQLFWGLVKALDTLNLYSQELKYVQLPGLYPLLEKYSLNWRWLLSASGGVLCVTLVAPGFSSLMLSLGGTANHAWFETRSEMSAGQLVQVQDTVSEARSLPNSELIISGFPEAWKALYGFEETDSSENIATTLIPSSVQP